MLHCGDPECVHKKSHHPRGGGGSKVLKAVRTAPVRLVAKGWPCEPLPRTLTKYLRCVGRTTGLDSVSLKASQLFCYSSRPVQVKTNCGCQEPILGR